MVESVEAGTAINDNDVDKHDGDNDNGMFVADVDNADNTTGGVGAVSSPSPTDRGRKLFHNLIVFSVDLTFGEPEKSKPVTPFVDTNQGGKTLGF